MKLERRYLSKLLIVFAILLSMSPHSVAGQSKNIRPKSVLSEADKAWGTIQMIELPTLTMDSTVLTEIDKKKDFKRKWEISTYKNEEVYKVRLREWGIDFWKKFPNDIRRFEWLRTTITLPPHYFIDIESGAEAEYNAVHYADYSFPLDTNAIKEWDKLYETFRSELINSSQISERERIKFITTELTSYSQIWRMKWLYARHMNEKFDLEKWTKNMLDFAPLYYEKNTPAFYNDPILAAASTFFSNPNDYGLRSTDLKTFATTLFKSGIPNLRNFGQQKLSLLALQKEPIKLIVTAVDGKEVNLDKMRGELVLLDFWSTYCSYCIAKMPEVKTVYEKYQSQGFKVISICINPEMDKEKVLKIHHDIGAKWPLLIIGGNGRGGQPGLGRELWRKYGFFGVPQLLLIGPHGTLIEYQGKLLVKGKLEEIVRCNLDNTAIKSIN